MPRPKFREETPKKREQGSRNAKYAFANAALQAEIVPAKNVNMPRIGAHKRLHAGAGRIAPANKKRGRDNATAQV
jgi:hypothetical protein